MREIVRYCKISRGAVRHWKTLCETEGNIAKGTLTERRERHEDSVGKIPKETPETGRDGRRESRVEVRDQKRNPKRHQRRYQKGHQKRDQKTPKTESRQHVTG